MKTNNINDIKKGQSYPSIFNDFSTYFKFWKEKGIFSALHWKVIFYWTSIIFFIGYIPIYLISRPRILDNLFINISSNYYPVMVIISLSFIVIAVGTTFYAHDVYVQTFKTTYQSKVLKKLYEFSLIFCLLSIALCGIGLYNFNYGNNIHKIVEITEDYTKYIFCTLLVVDVLMLIAKSLEIKYYKNKKSDDVYYLEKELKFIYNQMIFIDIPVLIGVLFIAYYIQSAEITGFYSTQLSKIDKVNNFQFFKTFFAVGSIGMHIIFSQFIFVILNTKNIYLEIVNPKK